jgi:Protein of unknown function (DUF3833)
MRFLSALVVALIFPLLGGCSRYTTEDYANASPKLDIREYLSGNITAHGMIFDWKGKATRHFVAKIKGTWEGNVGTLDEVFTYSDATTQTRVWTLTFSDDHTFTGTAGDVIGTAEGTQNGNAVNMAYTLRHKDTDGSTIDLRVDDWLFLTAEGVVINRTKLYKFGIPVGEVMIAFTKEN